MTPRSRFLRIAAIAAGLAAAVAGVRLAAAQLGLRLRIEREVAVHVPAGLPVRASFARPLEVGIDEQLPVTARLADLAIPIAERIEVPLKLELEVPIDTDVEVDERIEVTTTVPLDLVLTERELDLRKLEIPIDTEVFVDDELAIDTVVPIDTTVTTTLGVRVPVKAQVRVQTKVPIRQGVRIKDTLAVGMPKVRVPLKIDVPVRATVPIKERIHVKGTVRAPIDRVISIPIDHVVHPKLDAPVAAVVAIKSNVRAQLAGELDARISLDRPIAARIGELQITADDVSIERR